MDDDAVKTHTSSDEQTVDVLESVERDLTLLVRNLEALSRRRRYPLERAYYVLLCTLKRVGKATIGELAEALALDNSTVTRQVAAMQRLKLVTRTRMPDDARSVEVEPTPYGLTLATEMRTVRLRRMRDMFDGWIDGDMQDLHANLSRLNGSIRAQLDRAQAQGTDA